MKKTETKKILIGILVVVCLLASCVIVLKTPVKNTAPHVAYSKSDIDYSKQAQAYMEFIGTKLPKRCSFFDQHDKTRAWIVSELTNAGYSREQISLQKVDGHRGQNIVLKVDGADPSCDKFIVAGAHYDGDGVGDNGSGTALLLAEAVGLKQHELPVTTYFVFFDAEEVGGFGATTFVNSLSEDQLNSILYMLNLDAIAFGDYCNIYGGNQNPETKAITQTEVYDYACALAEDLGFNVYRTEDLDGYYAKHGEGPALDPLGLFTNPWTLQNPAPENTVDDSNHAYSPTTIPYSDHADFVQAGVPYIYFEATNWYVADPNDPSISYIGYSDVGDVSLGENGVIMNTKYDNLEYLNEHFPGRSLEHFKLYSPLMSKIILEPYGL